MNQQTLTQGRWEELATEVHNPSPEVPDGILTAKETLQTLLDMSADVYPGIPFLDAVDVFVESGFAWAEFASPFSFLETPDGGGVTYAITGECTVWKGELGWLIVSSRDGYCDTVHLLTAWETEPTVPSAIPLPYSSRSADGKTTVGVWDVTWGVHYSITHLNERFVFTPDRMSSETVGCYWMSPAGIRYANLGVFATVR